MDSGLLRTLTDKSARESARGDADIVAAAPPQRGISETEALQSTTQSVAPRSQRSRVFVIAGVVAAIVLTFDAWLIAHHRPPTRQPPAAPAAPSNALPTYALLPLGTPPPPDPAPRDMPAAAPANVAVLEKSAPAVVAPAPHRHRHGHHRR